MPRYATVKQLIITEAGQGSSDTDSVKITALARLPVASEVEIDGAGFGFKSQSKLKF